MPPLGQSNIYPKGELDLSRPWQLSGDWRAAHPRPTRDSYGGYTKSGKSSAPAESTNAPLYTMSAAAAISGAI